MDVGLQKAIAAYLLAAVFEQLGYGVAIWVCEEHGSPEFQRLHDGRGSSVRQVEIGFGDGNQLFDLTSYTRHIGEDTTGDLLSKGVFLDRAREAAEQTLFGWMHQMQNDHFRLPVSKRPGRRSMKTSRRTR